MDVQGKGCKTGAHQGRRTAHCQVGCLSARPRGELTCCADRRGSRTLWPLGAASVNVHIACRSARVLLYCCSTVSFAICISIVWQVADRERECAVSD